MQFFKTAPTFSPQDLAAYITTLLKTSLGSIVKGVTPSAQTCINKSKCNYLGVLILPLLLFSVCMSLAMYCNGKKIGKARLLAELVDLDSEELSQAVKTKSAECYDRLTDKEKRCVGKGVEKLNQGRVRKMDGLEILIEERFGGFEVLPEKAVGEKRGDYTSG